MTKLLFTILIITTTLSSFAYINFQEDIGMAKVQKVEGKEVYLFAEPLRTYKVVEDYNNSKSVISSCNLRNLIDIYLKKGKKDKVNFDALYMDASENIYLIKFIKEAN